MPPPVLFRDAPAPTVTQVRVAPTRIPQEVRSRLTRLARRGAEVCNKHGAELLAEICTALEIALLDLASAELRATNAERRARRAESDLAQATAQIRMLQADLAERIRAEFEEPTRTRERAELVAECRR